MAKDQFIDYDSTPVNNTDIGSIDIQGTANVLNFDNAFREHMAQHAETVTRHVTKAAGSYTALKTDYNQLWRATGAVTVNLTAAATLTDGWCIWLKADGGAITVDPNSSETINGASTLTIADGNGAFVLCTGSAFCSLPFGHGAASTTAKGVVELATDAEAQTGTDTERAITPANLQAVTSTETRKGVVELATNAEVVTGSDTERAVTPAGLASAYRGKQEIWIPARDFTAQPVSGASFNTRTLSSGLPLVNFAFDQTSPEHILAQVALPKRYNNSSVGFLVYWTANGGTAGQGVQWAGALYPVSDDDTLNVSTGAFSEYEMDADTYIVANDLHITAVATIIPTGNNAATGDLFWLRVSRLTTDIADTLAADAELVGVKITWIASAGNDA